MRFLLILLLSVSVSGSDVQIYNNINRDELRERIDAQLAQERLSQISMETDGEFTLTSFRSKLVVKYNLKCSKVETANPLDVYDLTDEYLRHNPFTQVLLQADGDYTVVSYHSKCS